MARKRTNFSSKPATPKAEKSAVKLTYTTAPETKRWHLVPSEGLDASTHRLASQLVGKQFDNADLAIRVGMHFLGHRRIRRFSDFSALHPDLPVPFELKLVELDEALSQVQSSNGASEEELSAQLGVISGLEYELSLAKATG